MSALLETLREYLAYPFVQKALVAGPLVALAAALLGVTLVLRRLSYIGDSLSHVAFGSMAVAGALGFADRLALSLPLTVLCAVALLHSGRGAAIRGDAALAMLSVGAMALGYLLMNVFPGSSNVAGDVCTTLFGSTSILTLSPSDVWLCGALSGAVAVFFGLFRHRIFEIVFEPDFARAAGTRVGAWETLLAVLSAVVIVLAMRLVGTLLITALLVFPAVGAMRAFRSFRAVLLCASLVGVLGALAGILVSILAGTPVGSTVVAADIAACLVLTLAGGLRK
ncbi:MAG: metal ABC transporter permease [Kiritimatiellae bacterium]|nr:metal ABC transporter permease [Kiritimatiellia bacterium]